MKWFWSLLLITIIIGCSDNMGLKKRGYPQIKFPTKTYIQFNQPGYPYSFEYPTYATVERDSNFFDVKPENDFWLNINFPSLNGKIYVSYKSITNAGKNSFDSLVQQAFTMTYKNTYKASAIRPEKITGKNGANGLRFELDGDVATAKQFFFSDSTKHFFRGALYFDATPNIDSLRLVYDFLAKDLEHLTQTFKWEK
jgi:gliding motility-associated lipoprotein GldD